MSPEDVRADILGEKLATRALAEACCGDSAGANRSLLDASRLASDVRTQVLICCTGAVLALKTGASTLEQRLGELAAKVTSTGCFDSAVCALRACPDLLAASTRNAHMAEVIRKAASRSGDAALAAAIGMRTIARREQRPLSARETEVLELAAEGFHNDEIGRRLFISTKTVKTHLQNVYEKLNVSSRTEAAIKAKEAGLLS
jgi:ATP/maltotriose-dependent transcriptional regulator MalT